MTLGTMVSLNEKLHSSAGHKGGDEELQAEHKENLSLIRRLAKIRVMCDVVTKDKRGYNYSYADVTEILAKITAGMKSYGVSLIPQIKSETAKVEQNVITNTKFDKTGKSYDSTTTEMLFSAEMSFKWVNDDNPQDFIEVPWFVVGAQSDPSQAFGAGLTYCTRYFLTNYFQIAQTDTDVDAYRSKQKAAEASEDRAIAEGIIEKFDILLKQYLADHKEKSEEVKKFIGKYARNSNYLNIREPSLAAKLLEDFTGTYLQQPAEKKTGEKKQNGSKKAVKPAEDNGESKTDKGED